MAEEPEQKKIRTDVLHTVGLFEEFRSNNVKYLKLKNALKSLHVIGVSFLKVEDTNARSPVSLSKATCRTQEIWVEKEFPACMSFRSIFTFGYKLLDEFLTSGSVPKKEMYKEALRKLLQFLLDDTDDRPALSAGSSKYGSEKNWAFVITQHLLSKLSVTTEFLADSATMKEVNCCPCDRKEMIPCKTGNTSIGCVKGWQGELDIIIGMEMPVKVAQITDDCLFDENISQYSASAEVTKHDFTKSDLNQMLAQTILFSFYKGKGLIPCIGLASSVVKLHFYHCEKDILLRSNTLNLMLSEEHESFETVTILMLWLTLNYELLCSGVPDELKNLKAGFHEELGSFLECYKNTTSPFPVQLNDHEEEKEPTYRGYFDSYKDPDIVF